MVERTIEDTLKALFDRREVALRAGTARIRTRVVRIGEHREIRDGAASASSRFPVRVDWDFLSVSGTLIARNELRYYCRYSEDGEIRIEILEFVRQGIASVGTVTNSKPH